MVRQKAREYCFEVRRKHLLSDPDSKFIAYISLEDWKSWHEELKVSFNPNNPFETFSRFMGARVVINDGWFLYMKE